MPPMQDVFLSYSPDDRAWVEQQLAPRLRRAGLSVLAGSDTAAGSNTAAGSDTAAGSTTAEQALLECPHTVMVLSPAYLNQGWSHLENLILQTLPSAQREQRLIPVLHATCDLPPRISHLAHIDLRPLADTRRNWRRLLHALGAPELLGKRPPSRATWWMRHPFVDAPGFTGRVAERQLLSHWLTDGGEPVLLLRASFGFGKSSLVWHWLHHDVRPVEWPKVLWWSCCGANTGFEDFLFHAVAYFHDMEPAQVAEHSRADQLQLLLQALETSGRLIVLDGFERWLEADSRLDTTFLAPPELPLDDNEGTPPSRCNRRLTGHFLERLAANVRSAGRVLLTSRLVPDCLLPGGLDLDTVNGHRADGDAREDENDIFAGIEASDPLEGDLLEGDLLEDDPLGGDLAPGCLDYRLRGLADADIAGYFRDREIEGTTSEILRAGAAYNQHPLSLRLLTGILRCDVGTPKDIAALRRLNVTGSALDRRQHLLERAHDTLPTRARALLDTLACCRRAVAADVLFTIHGDERDQQPHLDELVNRGLIQYSPYNSPYNSPQSSPQSSTESPLVDLPVAIRRYVYGRIPIDRRAEIHRRLQNYYAQRPQPETVLTTGDLEARLELYVHRVRAGDFEDAFEQLMEELVEPLNYKIGDPRQMTETLLLLFPGSEDRPPRLSTKLDQADAMAGLGMGRSIEGRTREALDLRLRTVALLDQLGETSPNAQTPQMRESQAAALANLAVSQLDLGQLQVTEATLRRLLELAEATDQAFVASMARRELGRIAIYRGRFEQADQLLTRSQREFEQQDRDKAIGIGHSHRAFYCLSRARVLALTDHAASLQPVSEAITAAKRALEVADSISPEYFPAHYDTIRARALLGIAYRRSGDLEAAEGNLTEALRNSIALGHQHAEAGCLLELARLRWEDTQVAAAEHLARQALVVTEQCSYVLRQADVHLMLARFANEQGDPASAKLHAREAHLLATGSDPEEWCYRVARDEALRLLRQLGVSP